MSFSANLDVLAARVTCSSSSRSNSSSSRMDWHVAAGKDMLPAGTVQVSERVSGPQQLMAEKYPCTARLSSSLITLLWIESIQRSVAHGQLENRCMPYLLLHHDSQLLLLLCEALLQLL